MLVEPAGSCSGFQQDRNLPSLCLDFIVKPSHFYLNKYVFLDFYLEVSAAVGERWRESTFFCSLDASRYSLFILLSCILMHKSSTNMDAMLYSTVGPKGGFSVVNSPVSSAFSSWSQFVSQSGCWPAVCRRFMSQGASGQRGDHIMGMMALLSWVPSQKTRQAGAG